jgi:hypothetical protein
VSWIRRTRIEGDSWDLPDVPLGEAREQYRVRILRGQTLLREDITTQSAWAYDLAMQAADTVLPGDMFEVAQLSDRFGAGFAARAVLE